MDCPRADVIQALLDAQIDEDERIAVLDHAGACANCHAVLVAWVRAKSGSEASPTPERRVDRYIIGRQLGAGAMGVVLAAYDPELNRHLALKLLRPDHRGGEGGSRARMRLQREAQAMACLTHPNVVTVFDAGTIEDQVYVAMELVEGETLREWLRREPRPWRGVIEMFLGAGRGLAAAHSAGLVHRDFKPDNVLIGKDGRARVSDFGLASTSSSPIEDSGQELHEALRTAELLRGLTLDGVVLGTPAYMAPEQHDGASVDARADQFAFCVALYEALYGERPFRAATYQELVLEVKQGHVREPARRTRAPVWLRTVLLRGLNPRPEARFASMDALLGALARDPAKRRNRALGAGAIVVLTGLAMWGLVRDRSPEMEPCTGARDHLVGVWDIALRSKVELAFRATGRPYAEETFVRTAARLDRYADGWAAMHTEACQATRARGEQSEELLDLRMACLDRRRGELGALVHLFTSGPDEQVLDNAVQATAELSQLQTCADTEALLKRQPASASAAQVKAADALRGRLTQIEALERAGKLKEALTLAGPASVEATRIGYAPIQAEASGLLGRLRSALDDAAGAEAALLEAMDVAGRVNDDALLSGLLETYASVLQGGAGRYAESLGWARLARSVAERASDPLAIAKAELALAGVAERMGRYADARTHTQTALGIYRQHVEKDDPLLVAPLSFLAQLAMTTGQLEEARTFGEQALAVAQRAYGDSHPQIAVVLETLGKLAGPDRKRKQFTDYVSRALAMREKIYGPDHPQVALTLLVMAQQTADQGQRAVLFERSLKILEHEFGPDHPDVAKALLPLGMCRYAQHLPDQAEPLLQRALTVSLRAYGPHHPSTGSAHYGLGLVALELDRRVDAEKHFHAAIDALGETIGQTETLANAQFALGDMLAGQGRCSEARPYLEAALLTIEKLHGVDDPFLSPELTVLGECDLVERRYADSITRLERAIGMLEKIGMGGVHTSSARGLLAKALWEEGKDRKRALAQARMAETELATAGPQWKPDLVELHRWLATHR